MNFLKKLQTGAKSKTKSKKQSRLSDSPALAELLAQDASAEGLSDVDVERRKAEFLELLAKEERAHRVKLAELRNEPIEDRRASDKTEKTAKDTSDPKATKVNDGIIDIVNQSAPRTPLPPVSPRFDDIPTKASKTKANELDDDPSFVTKATRTDVPRAAVPRPTETETRAAIGKTIGGEDLLKGSTTTLSTPELSLNMPADAPHEDVTPRDIKSVQAETQEVETAEVSAPTPPSLKDYADMDFSRPIKGGRANVGELRLDVSRIHSDIENGEALYRRAQQRVQGLMHFVEKAEVDFSLLERIEPENRRLKARNAIITKELEDTVRKTSLLEADLEEHRRRLAEVNVQYDTVNGNLAKAMKALTERDREIRQLTNDISAVTLKLDREKTATEVEIRENNVLRDRVVNLTNDLEDAKSARADTTRTVESLKIDLEDHRNARDRIETEAYDLRRTLDEAQKQNNQMKGEMVALHQDISTFKTQYEFNIISRDDRIILLEAQIEDLARQLQVKEDIVSSAARDVTELRKSRTGGELERERLEKIIDTQTMQLEIAQKQILEAQAEVQEMDTRYRDVAAALSITQNRRAQQTSSKSPDIHPEMAPRPITKTSKPSASATSSKDTKLTSDDYGVREKDEIEDHIMDYKLGLRNNLISPELQAKLDGVSLNPDNAETASDETGATPPRRDDNFDALDDETIEDRIMDYKLGLRKNIF
jgi:hypothetical protein